MRNFTILMFSKIEITFDFNGNFSTLMPTTQTRKNKINWLKLRSNVSSRHPWHLIDSINCKTFYGATCFCLFFKWPVFQQLTRTMPISYSLLFNGMKQDENRTRMRSSRMRAICCSSHLLGGGGGLPRGVSAQRGVSALGVSAPLWTEWQTGVKTLPCCNYVADVTIDLI